MTTVLRDPSFDPVIEVDAAAIAHNVHEVARLAGRPILAVVKNNGYGLGLTTVGPIIDSLDDVVGSRWSNQIRRSNCESRVCANPSC